MGMFDNFEKVTPDILKKMGFKRAIGTKKGYWYIVVNKCMLGPEPEYDKDYLLSMHYSEKSRILFIEDYDNPGKYIKRRIGDIMDIQIELMRWIKR